jgi:hypothetical protein
VRRAGPGKRVARLFRMFDDDGLTSVTTVMLDSSRSGSSFFPGAPAQRGEEGSEEKVATDATDRRKRDGTTEKDVGSQIICD